MCDNHGLRKSNSGNDHQAREEIAETTVIAFPGLQPISSGRSDRVHERGVFIGLPKRGAFVH